MIRDRGFILKSPCSVWYLIAATNEVRAGQLCNEHMVVDDMDHKAYCPSSYIAITEDNTYCDEFGKFHPKENVKQELLSCLHSTYGIVLENPTRHFVLIDPLDKDETATTVKVTTDCTEAVNHVSIEDCTDSLYKRVVNKLKKLFTSTEDSYCKELPKYQK